MTHLPAVVEVADFAGVEVVAYVPVVAYVLVVSRAVAAIAWPEDLGLHIQSASPDRRSARRARSLVCRAVR